MAVRSSFSNAYSVPYALELTIIKGAEFHESIFELLPVDEEAAKVLHGSAFETSFRYCVEAGQRIGRDFNAVKDYSRWLIEAGFVDVVVKQYLSPVNGWPAEPKDKRVGNWCESRPSAYPTIHCHRQLPWNRERLGLVLPLDT